jgi:hypothetical protein
MFVIWNVDKKAWVALPGLASSFTKDISKIRFFGTREEAEIARCGNEVVRNFYAGIGPF